MWKTRHEGYMHTLKLGPTALLPRLSKAHPEKDPDCISQVGTQPGALKNLSQFPHRNNLHQTWDALFWSNLSLPVITAHHSLHTNVQKGSLPHPHPLPTFSSMFLPYDEYYLWLPLPTLHCAHTMGVIGPRVPNQHSPSCPMQLQKLSSYFPSVRLLLLLKT